MPELLLSPSMGRPALLLALCLAGCSPVPDGPLRDRDPGWAGEYRGRFDGDVPGIVTVTDRNGRLDVAIEAASSRCNGQLKFSAPAPAGPRLVSGIPPESGANLCTITLARDGKRLAVSEQNCGDHHGRACSFEGILTR